MAFVTPRMSLKVRNSSSDPYDHEQLADNFLKLDIHDHSQGRGAQIPGSGIQPGAITAEHIYPGSIGGDALGDQSISGSSLQDDSVGNQQLHPNARIPVGTVLDWYCADPSTIASYLPDGWAVCDGSTVLAGEHEIPGANPAANFTLPNLIGCVVVGANPAAALNAAGSAGDTTANAPGVGGTGGSNATANFSHSHTITVPPHYHFDNLSTDLQTQAVYVNPGEIRVTSNWIAGRIWYAGANTYYQDGSDSFGAYYARGSSVNPDFLVTAAIRGTAVETASGTNTGFAGSQTHAHGLDFNDYDGGGYDGATTRYPHNHTVTGVVSGVRTGAFTADGNNYDGGTGQNTSSTNGASSFDKRMRYAGLLKIMKVKNV